MKKNWLYGKTIIITGASGGIGFSIAKMLIEKYDCKIIGVARNEQKMLRSVATLGDKKDNFSYRLFDVTDKSAWESLKSELEEKEIYPDVLINNAGFMLPFSKFENYTENEIDEIINTNFISVINATRIMLPLIKKSSSPAIINTSSAAGLCAVVGQSMYSATKFAVAGFTQTLAVEYKKKIYIGGIYPGFIKTDILSRQTKNTANTLVEKMMMPLNKATKKIVRAIAKKKKRKVMGVDGRLMAFFSKVMPKATPSIVAWVLKKSKMELFEDVFD